MTSPSDAPEMIPRLTACRIGSTASRNTLTTSAVRSLTMRSSSARMSAGMASSPMTACTAWAARWPMTPRTVTPSRTMRACTCRSTAAAFCSWRRAIVSLPLSVSRRVSKRIRSRSSTRSSDWRSATAASAMGPAALAPLILWAQSGEPSSPAGFRLAVRPRRLAGCSAVVVVPGLPARRNTPPPLARRETGAA